MATAREASPGPETKRRRVDDAAGSVCERFTSSYKAYVRDALQQSALDIHGLRLGARIQVLWTLHQEDGTEEDVWWSGTLEGRVRFGRDAVPAWTIRYDPSEELGFAEELREVSLSGVYRTLVDLQEGGEPMPWRVEDEEDEEEVDLAVHADGAVLPPGTKVKAHFQGGPKAYAGEVVRAVWLPCDSREGADEAAAPAAANNAPAVLYDVLYEDGVCEEGVPAEFVHMATAPSSSAPVDSEDVSHGDIESFFNLAVTALTSGKVFQSLTAVQQRLFAECVRRSKPHFERELSALLSRRGHGTLITAEDITSEILPRVMPDVTRDFRRIAAAGGAR